MYVLIKGPLLLCPNTLSHMEKESGDRNASWYGQSDHRNSHYGLYLNKITIKSQERASLLDTQPVINELPICLG